MTKEQPGLRELKKQMTRDAIAAAALKLTKEKGLSQVTIDEIAQEAFVSPRTVSNYFPAKEDAVLATGRAGFEAMLCEYGAGTQKGNPIEVVREIFSKHAEEHPEHLRRIAELVELERQNPTLKPFRVAQEAEFSTTLSELIASRFDIDAAQDPYPALTAAAIVSAITTSLSLWSKCGCSYDCLPELVDKSFNIAAAGYAVERD
jgi:AcrR family transcriptional regulator